MVDEQEVRRITLSLPETTERASYGMPGFRVKDRLFARIMEPGDALVIWCADEAEKLALAAAEPAKFFTTPHYDGHPILCVRFDGVDRRELTELVTESWRLRAPLRLRTAFDDVQEG
ncbi:MmcQ/YjbR family DNA-binding protein [soil metagenome]